MALEILEEQRESWGTRGGFILAAVGSAVGLGNLWGFPYKLYSYGGGAFLIPYITAMFCIGIPLLILEFSLGHLTQRAAPDAFGRINRRLEFVGWWGIILGFVIVTYYPVILAYCLSFLKYSVEGMFNGGKLPWAGQGIEGVANAKSFFFDKYLQYNDTYELTGFRWNIFGVLVVTWFFMYLCIFKGVNLVGKIVWLTVPLPWLMLLVLTVRALTLEGSMKGLVYYLDPVWSQLAKPVTWRYAFGQVFFSLSLAFGVMVTYASFLHRKSDINNNAAIIGISDFITSFVAGLAVFATLGAMAFATQQAGNPVDVENVVQSGPSLAFVAFPYALAQLPYSAWFSFVFFFALVTLGIDSAFSITESVLAGIVDKTGWRRSVVLPLMSLAGFALGLFYITNGGLNWLGVIDGFINGTWGIAFLGLLECVVLGWLYNIDRLRVHANERSDWKLGRWWNYSIRIFIPIVLGTLVVWSLIDDLTNPAGFLKDAEGEWIISNCVGMSVVATAPVIAILVSIIKGPRQVQLYKADVTVDKGSKSGLWSLILATIAAISVIAAVKVRIDFGVTLLIFSLLLAVIGIFLSNYVLERDRKSAIKEGVFARIGGIVSTIDISVCFALVLFRVSVTMSKVTEQVKAVAESAEPEKLTGVSYLILSAVSLIMVGGLGWCFYRAVTADTANAPEQLPDNCEK